MGRADSRESMIAPSPMVLFGTDKVEGHRMIRQRINLECAQHETKNTFASTWKMKGKKHTNIKNVNYKYVQGYDIN